MEIRYYKEYSPTLNREMEFKVYGDSGIPLLAFPAQNGRFFDLENFGLIDCISEYVDSGKVQVFTCDTIDEEHYSDEFGDIEYRSYMLEQYYYYICDELVQRIHDINGSQQLIYTTGVSLGATHCANMFFRRPDIFGGCIALSGYYDSDLFFGDYHNDYIYNNSPIQYLGMMERQHEYVKLYNQRQIILCCGQGAWEDEMVKSSSIMQHIFKEKGIEAWVDFWGYDVNHDWPWWKIQLPYFLERITGGVE